ncbi:MAG: hypothetical protein CMJ87_01765 [Planctomycetes bacterium]|jgi:hypothetical protein|nr:hypothetical protein [Planctomycetota bacterium]
MDRDLANDLRTLALMVEIWCEGNHAHRTRISRTAGMLSAIGSDMKPKCLCDECAELLSYGSIRRQMCPHEEKPLCKECETHCYRAGYREQIRELMRYSGVELLKRGRIDLVLAHKLGLA